MPTTLEYYDVKRDPEMAWVVRHALVRPPFQDPQKESLQAAEDARTAGEIFNQCRDLFSRAMTLIPNPEPAEVSKKLFGPLKAAGREASERCTVLHVSSITSYLRGLKDNLVSALNGEMKCRL